MVLAILSSWSHKQSSSLSNIEQLGKNIFYDKISNPDNMSCADCHGPGVGFTGPDTAINIHGGVYFGAVIERSGNRKPPSAAYATLAPIFHYDSAGGFFVGGNFWDGRATGAHLGNPAADQALGPPLNPVEMNNPNKQAVLMQIASSTYAYLWDTVFGEPLTYSTTDEIELNYDRVGLAIAAYEGSSEVNAFSSKYDYYMNGQVSLTTQEFKGKSLFEGKGMCVACHMAPNFTDFTFENPGVPKNPENPFYHMDKVYLPDGSPINPLGEAYIDYGLGGFLQTVPEYASLAGENMGKLKIPTLRNADMRPVNNFTKAYMHNGVFKSLKEVVHFYNTRDDGSWPQPEVSENINTTGNLGNLGLTDAEEDDIVAFVKTLSDGYLLTSLTPAETPGEFTFTVINPVTYATHVSFFLPVSSYVTIGIYSLIGGKVFTLADGFYSEGNHNVDISPDDFKPGLYILQMTESGHEHVKKIIITQ
jgi:cytochrome c peroxidase